MHPVVQVLIIAGVSLASLCLVMLAFRLFSPAPAGLGGPEGLQPCPDKPNAVSSSDPRPSHHIAPFPCPMGQAEAIALIERMMAGHPRSSLVQRDGPYIHFECRSLLFRFIDDIEFLVDAPHGLVEVRSASRAGHSDLGVNRARVENLRRRWEAALKKRGPA